MQRSLKRLLTLLLAALMGIGILAPLAQAEDWRDLLLSLKESMLEEAGDVQGDVQSEEDKWALPITEPQRIVNYLAAFGELPDNFITKKEAQALGWDSSRNYVGDVAPGKSIGGDRFGNYEGRLPRKKGRVWYECDTGYTGKKRGATRLLFSSDGLYYYTSDHYNTFTEMFPEGQSDDNTGR